MATIFQETFDSGTDGVTITSSNSAFTSTIGADIVFSNVQSLGSLSAHVLPVASSSTLYYTWSGTTKDYASWYVYLNALPSSLTYLASLRSTGDKTADLRVNTNGTVTIRNGNSAVYTTTAALTTGTWHRIDWATDSTTGVQRVRLSLGANRHGTTPDEDSGNQTYSGAANISAHFGCITSSTIDYYLDHVTIDDTTWPDPAETGPTGNTYLGVDGQWVPVALYVGTDGQWVEGEPTAP